jgi:hypothetical protein
MSKHFRGGVLMRKVLISVLALAVAYGASVAGAFASPRALSGQGKSGQNTHGKSTRGKKAETAKATSKARSNKPGEKGLPRAEEVANPQGVTHGLEKAETKQATHETTAETAIHKGKKGKHLAKGKPKSDH